MKQSACPACGARLPQNATRCQLCGTDAAEWDALASADPVADETAPAAGPVPDAGPRTCASCAEESSSEARFCWKCGEELASPSRRPAVDRVPEAANAKAERADAAGRHAFVMVGGAAALLVVLFLVNHFADRPRPVQEEAPAQTAEMVALPEEIAGRVDTLERTIASAEDGEERMQLRERLVETLIMAGAFVRAAEVQEAIARERDDVDSWADAGSFYLAHVLRTEAPPEQAVFAERSARAFERALELRPGDVDIKTDLATAYRYHPEDPMRAVTIIQEVLAENPQHARALFNYGLMLAQIGRNDQALEQFQQVIALTTGDDFVHERAREIMAQLGAPPFD